MGGQNNFGALLQHVLYGRYRPDDTGILGDCPLVILRHIKIDPNENFFPLQILDFIDIMNRHRSPPV